MANADVDHELFAEWIIENMEEFSEGIFGNAARWGANQAARFGKWGADKSMQGLNKAGQGMQKAATHYERWRDPISRVNTAVKALDQVIAAYGNYKIEGGMPVARVLEKMKRILMTVQQSVDAEKQRATEPG